MKKLNRKISAATMLALLVQAATSCLNTIEHPTQGGNMPSFCVSNMNLLTKAEDKAAEKITENEKFRFTRTDSPMESPLTRSNTIDNVGELKSGTIGMMIYDCPSLGFPVSQMVMHTSSPIHVWYNDNTGLWIPTEYQRWSTTSGYLRFYSWYPYDQVAPVFNDGAVPTFSFEAEENISLQKDIVMSSPVTVLDDPSSYPVSLAYSHVLAGVRFAVRHGYTIDDIKLEGIYDSGTCSFADGSFSGLTAQGNEYTLTSPSVTQSGFNDYTDNEYTMFLVPQTMPAGALITVTIDGNTLTADMSGQTITAGVLTTYNLDLFDEIITFEVDRSTLSFDYTGTPAEASEINVTSVRTYGPDTEYPGWTTQVNDNGTWIPLADAILTPEYSWLSSISTGSTNPAASSTNVPVSIPARALTSHEARLKSNRILDVTGSGYVDNSTEANAVDLSKYDFENMRMESARYTANCYVISSPGWYKFPLIYGNAIENDATVEYSYKGKIVALGHLDSFKNYKHDLPINNPWIEEDWAAWLIRKNHAESVRILWEKYTHYDSTLGSAVTQGRSAGSANMGVINNVSIITGADGRYVQFYVSPTNIKIGNAIIEIKDKGGDAADDEGETDALTMWSWHIWITDQPMATTTVTNTNGSWDIMPVNLGWTDDTEGTYYAPRSAEIRFIWNEDPTRVTGTVTVSQLVHEEESTSGWGTYYQWGRKDPFTEGLFTYKANYDTGMRGSIRHPDWFNSEVSTYFSTQYYDWATNNYDNLWDSQCTDYGNPTGALPNHKTVMDPSPRKYCVSPDYVWSGFESYGYNGAFNGGYHFYTNSSRTETVFFPATGYISYNGVMASSTDNRYWTNHAWASLQRRASFGLRFYASNVQNCYYTDNHRANGEAIRAVKFN